MASQGNVILLEDFRRRKETEEKLNEEEYIEREKLTDAEMKLETKIEARKKRCGKKFTFKQRWFPNIHDAEQMEIAKTGNYIARGTRQLFGRWTRSIAAAGLILWGVYQGIGNHITRDEGEYIGMIEYVRDEGIFFKTKEGKLYLEEMIEKGNYIDGGHWEFSVDKYFKNKEDFHRVYSKLEGFAEEGQRVRITYKQTLATWPWRARTRYLIQNVEPVEN